MPRVILTSPVCVAPIAYGLNKGETATGTATGYFRHRSSREPACAACLEAHRIKTARHRAANPEAVRLSARRYYASHRESERRRNQAYRAANLERLRARDRRMAAENRDARNEYKRQYRAANLVEIRRRDRQRQIDNKEKVAEVVRRQRARKKAAPTIPFTLEQLDARMSMFGHRCWMCGGPFEHVDHVKPLAVGGYHCLSNLRPACASCNAKKQARWPVDTRGFAWSAK